MTENLDNTKDGGIAETVVARRSSHCYAAPPNAEPFSDEGLRDLEHQCLEAAKQSDSALLEMAGLAIRRLLGERTGGQLRALKVELMSVRSMAVNDRFDEGCQLRKFRDLVDRWVPPSA